MESSENRLHGQHQTLTRRKKLNPMTYLKWFEGQKNGIGVRSWRMQMRRRRPSNIYRCSRLFIVRVRRMVTTSGSLSGANTSLKLPTLQKDSNCQPEAKLCLTGVRHQQWTWLGTWVKKIQRFASRKLGLYSGKAQSHLRAGMLAQSRRESCIAFPTYNCMQCSAIKIYELPRIPQHVVYAE